MITLFPEVISPYLKTSIVGRAQKQHHVSFHVEDLRPHGLGRDRVVDDRPYGGGEGMVLRPDVLASAVAAVEAGQPRGFRVLLSPQGRGLTPQLAQQLLEQSHLVLICGHYEGVDQRFIDQEVDLEVSIGDFVLTGGELPALVLIDWLVRQIPGVVGKFASVENDSFTDGRLKHPQYTRPEVFGGVSVPGVLRSGDHGQVAEYRQSEGLRVTRDKRPDLL